MAYLGQIVIALVGLGVVSLPLWIIFLRTITKIHFNEKEFYEKYDRASVEAMSERGGW